MEVIETKMEMDDSAGDESIHYMTIRVTPEQEAAMEAFFQINNWPLIKEVGELEIDNDGDASSRVITVHVNPQQETAMAAFFQINSWDLVGDEGEKLMTATGLTADGEEIQVQQIQDLQEVQDGEITSVEEVTAAEAQSIPQIITVYTNSGGSQGVPQIIVQNAGELQNSNLPQIIVQEITLPKNSKMGRNKSQTITIIPSEASRRVTPRGSVKPGDKVHKCNLCGKTFKQTPSFNGHYQSHFGDKPYKCEVCGTGFTLKAALVAHSSIHTGAKPFPCQLCDKSFRRKDDMLSHMRTHTGEKPYECDVCGRRFKYRNQIPKHKRIHTGERPYQCDHCEKRFSSNIHLRRHERTHTGERPFKCTTCGKAFTQYGHLQAHNRIHTDSRPFECQICGRAFREKKVLKKHESIHTMDKPYKCETCGKGFLRQSNMELHAVMHIKDGDEKKVRPKKRKNLTTEEMRQIVFSSVVKVDSGMQTDMEVGEELVVGPSGTFTIKSDMECQTDNIKTEIQEEVIDGSDTLAAFVQFAVENHELLEARRVEEQGRGNLESGQQDTLSTVQGLGGGDYIEVEVEESIQTTDDVKVEEVIGDKITDAHTVEIQTGELCAGNMLIRNAVTGEILNTSIRGISERKSKNSRNCSEQVTVLLQGEDGVEDSVSNEILVSLNQDADEDHKNEEITADGMTIVSTSLPTVIQEDCIVSLPTVVQDEIELDN
ncbi:hypothetical protein ACJMK2_020089 [Sinanodonta woodiana]|uniref:C2H2-type domain-containing protein n=1 Tax=Sinanodonta woodiana TaxID=1069815 RepID=A0ABD3U0S4_SINWO